MFDRINLAALHCKRLRIITHVRFSPTLARRIVGETHGHVRDHEPDYALYGTVYTAKKVPHVIRAYVHRVQNEYHVEFLYVAEKWPKPPPDIKSPEILGPLLAEEPQDVVLECDADFLYHQNGEWKSPLPLPMPLEKRTEGSLPFSHLEAIEFSRREKDSVQYSVQVRREDNGAIKHSVRHTELWKGPMTKDIPNRLLDLTSKLSRLLIYREREGQRAP